MSGPLLVTGGTGYLGSELLRQAPGAVGTWHSHRPEADWPRLDVRDSDSVRSTIAAVRPATVIHTAYKQSGDDARAITVDGARAVAAAAHEAGARLVHMSTDVLFDGLKGSPYVEEDPPTPIVEYGHLKADAEREVRAAHPEALIVRTSLIYGGDGASRHERIALDVARGERDMPFFTDEIRSPVQVSDLAAALLALVDTGMSGILNVAGADDVSRHELACLIARANGLDTAGIAAGTIADAGGPRPANCALDSSRARESLRTPLRGAYELFVRGNAERLLAAFDAWTRGDLEGALRFTHSETEWVISGAIPDLEPVYRGRDGVMTMWNLLRAAWDDIRVETERVIERTNEVIVYGRFRAYARGGMEVEHPLLWRASFSDGLIVSIASYWDRAEGERELGLDSESLADSPKRE